MSMAQDGTPLLAPKNWIVHARIWPFQFLILEDSCFLSVGDDVFPVFWCLAHFFFEACLDGLYPIFDYLHCSLLPWTHSRFNPSETLVERLSLVLQASMWRQSSTETSAWRFGTSEAAGMHQLRNLYEWGYKWGYKSATEGISWTEGEQIVKTHAEMDGTSPATGIGWLGVCEPYSNSI